MKRVDKIAYIGLFIVILLIVFVGSVMNTFLANSSESLNGFDIYISGGWQAIVFFAISIILLALMRTRSAFNVGLIGCGSIGIMFYSMLYYLNSSFMDYHIQPAFFIIPTLWMLFSCSYGILFKYKDPGAVQKWRAEIKNSKIIGILQYEMENQREISKSELVGVFGYQDSKAEKILKKLTIPINYRSDEIPELKEKVERVIQNLQNPTIYDIMNSLRYDLKTTKKVRKYLIDEKLVTSIPRVPTNQIAALPITPQKNQFETINRIKQTVLILGAKFTRLQVLEISEKSGIMDEHLIESVILDMISNKEIQGEYFTSSKSLALEAVLAVPSEEKEGLNVFISYSTLDTNYFRISKIVRRLELYPKIKKVIFWEEDSKQNIVEFMEETLKKTNVFALFCSENSINSEAVKGEWQAGYQLVKKGQMKMIPVYEDEDHIPRLLLNMLNVKFTKDDFEGFIQKLYEEILR